MNQGSIAVTCGWCRAYLGIGLAACLVFYPLAGLIFFGFRPARPYSIELPALFLLGVLSLPLLAHTRMHPQFNRAFGIPAAIFVLAVGVGIVINQLTHQAAFWWLAHITIPLAIAACWKVLQERQIDRIAIFGSLGLLWVANVALVSMMHARVGMGANPNWLAATTLASASFAYVTLVVLTGTNSLEVRGFYFIVIGLLTTWMIVYCQCKASVVAVLVYVVLRAMEGRSWQWRFAGLMVGCAALVVGSLLFADRLQRLGLDVRVPMWRGALAMVADHPLVGHGDFRGAFVKYKRDDHDKHPGAGAYTEHPHNEPLFLASSLGVPACIAWLMIVAQGVVGKRASPEAEAARWAVVILFVQGCFDKTLFTSPSSVLFPIALGMCLAERLPMSLRREPAAPARWVRWRRAAGAPQFNAALGYAGYAGGQKMLFDIHLRHAMLLDLQGWAHAGSAYRAANYAGETQVDNAQAQFYAGLIAVESLGQPQVARRHFSRVLELEPGFAFSYYFMARAALYDAADPNHAPAARQADLQFARQCLLKEIDNHPYSTIVREELVTTCTMAGLYDCALEADAELRELYQVLLALDCHRDNDSEQERLRRWQTELADRDWVRIKNTSGELVDGVLLETLVNLSLPTVAADDPRLKSFARSVSFLDVDVTLWSDTFDLARSFRVDRPEQLISRLSEVKWEPDERAAFGWPSEVWQARRGTSLEIACLTAAVCQLAGRSCVILTLEDEVLAAFEWEQQVYIYLPRTGSWEAISVEELNLLGNDTVKKLTGGTSAGTPSGHLFAYPHAFCPRNRALCAMLAIKKDLPPLPPHPYEQAARAKLVFGSWAPLRFKLEPFERLAADLAATDHGQ